jgi:hypothetical protein
MHQVVLFCLGVAIGSLARFAVNFSASLFRICQHRAD